MLNDKVKCEYKSCEDIARWELGFSAVIQNDSSGFLCGDNVSDIMVFCDLHFIGFNGCGNLLKFRKIGSKEWLNFEDYDNCFILEDLVKNSYKLYINNKLKFKKIDEF